MVSIVAEPKRAIALSSKPMDSHVCGGMLISSGIEVLNLDADHFLQGEGYGLNQNAVRHLSVDGTVFPSKITFTDGRIFGSWEYENRYDDGHGKYHTYYHQCLSGVDCCVTVERYYYFYGIAGDGKEMWMESESINSYVLLQALSRTARIERNYSTTVKTWKGENTHREYMNIREDGYSTIRARRRKFSVNGT